MYTETLISCPYQEALNAADYSVWIDEAGIRPGHKWRNEVADGIEARTLCISYVNSCV